MDKTHRKVIALSPLDKLRIEMVCKNIEDWDCLWKSVEGNVYMSMTEKEMREINALLNVIANNTMNTLSALKKSLGSHNPPQYPEGSIVRFMEQNINSVS